MFKAQPYTADMARQCKALDDVKGGVNLKDSTPKSKQWVNQCRQMHARWAVHTSGNAYVLYVQNRTMNHLFRVQSYGKNAHQAVRRYYRGLDNSSNWTWQCTKVLAVYDCVNTHTGQAGRLLHGQAQDRAPW